MTQLMVVFKASTKYLDAAADIGISSVFFQDKPPLTAGCNSRLFRLAEKPLPEAELLLREDVGEDSEGPEIPLMRRMSLPMAMEHAKKMINGEFGKLRGIF